MEYKIDDDTEPELSDKQKLGRLWRLHMYAMQKKKDFREQLKIYGLWITPVAGAAAILSFIMGNWPWRK